MSVAATGLRSEVERAVPARWAMADRERRGIAGGVEQRARSARSTSDYLRSLRSFSPAAWSVAGFLAKFRRT
jgi:hypothetical protein